MDESKIGGAILCAGFGTRMQPFTNILPKPLLPFLNTPIISYPLSQLTRLGVETVAINLHHLSETIPPVADRIAAAFGIGIKYVHEWEILGSGGGIIGMATCFGPEIETIVFMNGDTILDIDLTPHVQSHLDAGAAITLVVRPKAVDQPGRVFVENGEVVRIRDYTKPESSADGDEHDFLGIHIVQSSVLGELDVEACDIIDRVYGPLLERGESIAASVHDGFFAALDTPQLLYDTSIEVLKNPEQCSVAPLPDPLREGLYVYRPGTIASAAQVKPPVLIGANVEVGDGAAIGANVVCDGVNIKPGTTVRNSLIYGMGDIEGEWENCIAIVGKIVQL